MLVSMGREHTLRVLHISDLHARGSMDWRRRRVLGTAWEENLAALRQDGPFDLVCMTGDLAFSGEAAEYAEVTAFLDLTLQSLGVSRDRLFVVPGNHDVRRDTERKAWQQLRGLMNHHDAAAFSKWLAGGKAPRGVQSRFRHAVLRRQIAYRDWLATLGRDTLLPERSPHGRLGYRATLRLPDQPFNIHVMGLDSAWLAGDDGDARNLWLTEDQVMRLATERGEPLPGFRLALVHHPLTDLADGEHCRRLLASPAAGTGPLVDLLLRGHLHETEPETWADPERTLRQLAAGCLYEHDGYSNACIAITVTLDDTGRPLRHALRFRGWSSRGLWFDDNGLYPDTQNGRLVWRLADRPPDNPGPRVSPPRVLIGRETELAELSRLVGHGPVAVCAVQGMPGVGKTYLVDRFADLHADAFPGGYERLVLEPGDTRTADALRDVLRDRLDVTATGSDPWHALAQQLRARRTLVHVENVDSAELATAVAELVRHLDGCPLVVSGRFRDLGRSAGWARIEMAPFEEHAALAQLDAELGSASDSDAAHARRTLVQELGGLPLALHLAAGYLAAGHSVDGFLRKLRSKRLTLAPRDPADPVLHQGKARAILRSTFSLSLDLLREALAGQGNASPFMAGLAALGHAPAAGVGASLGAAITGLSDGDYEDLVVEARALSMLEDVPSRPGAVRMHPLLAELVRADAPHGDVVARMTAWFVGRLPERAHEQGQRWGEIHAEHAALVAWLALVPSADCVRVERAGSAYAWQCGPYLAWAVFCERCLQVVGSDGDRSHALWTLCLVTEGGGDLDRSLAAAEDKVRLDLARGAEREAALARGQIADVLEARGGLDEALRIRREEQLPVYERLGDVRSHAVTQGKIADVLEARGDLDEALRIRREEELPVYERLGDVRERALTQGKIADVLEARGDLDEALRIRREEELPVYERLGDVRSRAVTQGQIADVLQARGDLDEALRLRREEELPVYERLGDVRERAVTQGKIADVLEARGDLDEALRIRREEELSVYERLGDVRLRALTQGKIADVLEARGDLDEALRIRREEELPVYERLGDVRLRAVTQGQIADVLEARGDLDEALRIRREEELPVYERLGDVRSRAVTQGKIADVLQARGDLDEALRIRREEELPVYERLGDVRARAVTQGQIADVLEARGDLEEALRIRREEELPVYERLGARRDLAIGRANLAKLYLHRQVPGDRERATKLLRRALADARAMQLAAADMIQAFMRKHGIDA
jgi:tetratricopeptide (TPR) repeat protein